MPNPIDLCSWVALRSRPTPHLSSNSPPRGASDFGSFGGVKNNKSLAEMLNFHEKFLESWCPERALRAINESALILVHECPHFFPAALKIFKSCWAPEKKKNERPGGVPKVFFQLR